MEIFGIINKLLDLKIVQWALLTACIILIGWSIWSGIKYNALRLDHALLEANYAKASSVLLVQNDAVAQAGEEYKLREANLKEAISKASKIAVESNANMRRVLALDFSGEDCSGKIHQVYINLSSTRKH